MNEVTIRVPATSANLGPGYDCLGVALQIYNRVTVRQGGSLDLPMLREAAAAFFRRSELAPFATSAAIQGEVPQSRGMGSSVTVRLGLLTGLNQLAGEPLDTNALFELCAELEGHPDNAAPAAFGGFAVAKPQATPLRVDVASELKFVLCIPDFEVSTPAARAVLPGELPRLQAVASCVNACRVTAAFFQQRYELLAGAFEDHLHQPYRAPLIPFLHEVIAAGTAAGALGGFLSGSGSTICCLTLQDPGPVAEAMKRAAGKGEIQTMITQGDNLGAAAI